MSKICFYLLFLFPLCLCANSKIYLSCDIEPNQIIPESKVWLYINKETQKFIEISEDSIKKLESFTAGRESDLKESSESYNALNRTTLIYKPGLLPYQCRVVSRETLIFETKNFLDTFLNKREI